MNADCPTIVIDSREQAPLRFRHFPSVVAPLATADYSLLGCETEVGFERKSLDDLLGSLSRERERFERELLRLRGYRLRRLIIVGTMEQIEAGMVRSKMTPRSVLGSLDALSVRYDVPYEFLPTPEQAACRIERLCWYYWRDAAKRFQTVGTCPVDAIK